MAVIKLVEDYAVSQLRKDVRDAMVMTGELALVLQLYHAGDTDTVPCPQCGDDIYKSPEADCRSCYGTTFDGGVRQVVKVWTVFTDNIEGERVSNKGIWQTDNRHVQFEAFPAVTEHDVLVRVKEWSADGIPQSIKGFYMLSQVTVRSLRTGPRWGQQVADVVGQKAQLTELAPHHKMIQHYPIIGRSFIGPMRQNPWGQYPTDVANQVNNRLGVVADIAVQRNFPRSAGIFYSVAPAGPPTGPAAAGAPYAQSVGDGTTTSFTITHNLGTRDVGVVVYDNTTFAEVDADVVHADIDTVNVTFGDPPASYGYRVVAFAGTYTQAIGDGKSSTLSVAHNLGTRDVWVAVYNTSTLTEVDADVEHTDPSLASVVFEHPPLIGRHRAVVLLSSYAQNVGNAVHQSFDVTHNLGTRDVWVRVYDTTTYAEVALPCVHTDANTVTLDFGVAPLTHAHRVVVGT